MKLENKTTIITGGNSGIGLGIAKKFSIQGARVVITGRNSDSLEVAKESLGNNSETYICDVKKLVDIETLFNKIKKEVGLIDTLVVNAGVATVLPIEHTSESDFDHQINTNLKGAYFTIKNALPLLKKGSSIILISSIANSRGYEGMSVYSATKAAVRSLVRTLAKELAAKDIRINCISPGPIETPVFNKMGLQDEHVQGIKDAFTSLVPMARMGTTEEIANGALFLASKQSSYITGIDLAIDGGTAQV
jgi:NAD(P)-dependent dehydrogenase (short-subunit alcohol dehydrogenase family)